MSFRARRSLLARLVIALITTQLVVSVGLSGYAFLRVRDFHRETTQRELERLLPLLELRYDTVLADEVAARRLDAQVKRDAEETGLRITMIRIDGRVMAESEARPESLDNHLTREEISRALEHGSGSSIRHSRTTNMWTVYSARRAETAHGPVILRIARPLNDVDAQTNALLRGIAGAGVVSILALGGVLIIVTRSVSREARQLTTTAELYSQGRLDAQPPEARTFELAEIGEALQDMAQQLEKQMMELRAQQTDQQAILQSMSNGVIAIDLDQRILNINQAAERLLGVSAAAVRGRLLQEGIRQISLHQFVESTLRGSGARTAEFRLMGEPRITVQAVSETLIDPDGDPKGLLIILNDVTQLRRLETLRSDFAANVSHELRTPITNIKGYVETLLEVGLDDRLQATKFLEIIRKNSSRLASIVEDVLSLTRLEQPQARDQIEHVPTRVLPLLKAVVGQSEEPARARDMAIRIAAPDDLFVLGHSQLLEQALGNLVSNAINYSPMGTEVVISARLLDKDRVEIAVADQGSGIAPEHLHRIFERFYRVDKGRSREVGGTGLGLALVKHIALVHGGQVTVDSTVGKGSTFRLTLPAAANVAG